MFGVQEIAAAVIVQWHHQVTVGDSTRHLRFLWVLRRAACLVIAAVLHLTAVAAIDLGGVKFAAGQVTGDAVVRVPEAGTEETPEGASEAFSQQAETINRSLLELTNSLICLRRVLLKNPFQ